jgi:hypothetical protein
MKLVIVPAHRGWLWVKLGMQVFFRQPLALAGLFLLFMVIMTVLAQVPSLGVVFGMLLLPGLTLGLMAGTQEVTQQRFPTPLVLLSAFRKGRAQVWTMLQLGALYAVGCLLALSASYLVDDGSFARVYLGANSTAEAVLQEEARFVTAMAVFVCLCLPVSLLLWHAPALVHWHGLSAAKSVFFSLVACLRNFGAFVVFGLAWLGVVLLILVGITLLSFLLNAPMLASYLLPPLLLSVLAMFFASLFFSYRDCFEDVGLLNPATDPSAR